MNKLSTDLKNNTFTSRTHPLELEVCERNVLRAASPVSPVFFFFSVDHVQWRPDLCLIVAAWSTLPAVAEPCA